MQDEYLKVTDNPVFFTTHGAINYFYQRNAVCIGGGDENTNNYRKCIRAWRHV
jgi:hypothetical protein